MAIFNTRIQNKIDTVSNWELVHNKDTAIPLKGELIIYTFDNEPPRAKVGDGITKLSGLPFINFSNDIIMDEASNLNDTFIPFATQMVVFKDGNNAPRVKIGDGIHKLSQLKFLDNDGLAPYFNVVEGSIVDAIEDPQVKYNESVLYYETLPNGTKRWRSKEVKDFLVRFDKAQTIDEDDQLQACKNIGAIFTIDESNNSNENVRRIPDELQVLNKTYSNDNNDDSLATTAFVHNVLDDALGTIAEALNTRLWGEIVDE